MGAIPQKDASIAVVDRTLFGKAKDKKWWMTMRKDRMNDVKAEAGAV